MYQIRAMNLCRKSRALNSPSKKRGRFSLVKFLTQETRNLGSDTQLAHLSQIDVSFLGEGCLELHLFLVEEDVTIHLLQWCGRGNFPKVARNFSLFPRRVN